MSLIISYVLALLSIILAILISPSGEFTWLLLIPKAFGLIGFIAAVFALRKSSSSFLKITSMGAMLLNIFGMWRDLYIIFALIQVWIFGGKL